MKILYATDGFDAALAAEQLIERMADPDRVEITVLSVTPDWAPPYRTSGASLDVLEARRNETRAIVDAAVDRLRHAGFRATGQTAEGYPAEQILREADIDRYDLIVMGAGNRRWLGTRLFGSVSTHVFHSSARSVLIVHETQVDGEPHALLCVDGSSGAEIALKTLSGFAAPARTKINVVSVTPPHTPTFFAVPGAVYVPPHADELSEEMRRQAFARALGYADDAATELIEAGFQIHVEVLSGNPTEELLEEMDSEHYDLVVVGSRGLGPVRRALLGSVSDQLVRHAPATMVGRKGEG